MKIEEKQELMKEFINFLMTKEKDEVQITGHVSKSCITDVVLGDKISFTLTNGEPFSATAVQDMPNGMLFLADDCLKQEYPIFNECHADEIHDYFHSDLRRVLNTTIFDLFPDKIKKHMGEMDVDGSRDYVRIPTMGEIFPLEECIDLEEKKRGSLFYGMEDRHHRIAFQGKGTNTLEWYWLQDKVSEDTDAAYFANVNRNGLAYYYNASYARGVRPVFLLS